MEQADEAIRDRNLLELGAVDLGKGMRVSGSRVLFWWGPVGMSECMMVSEFWGHSVSVVGCLGFCTCFVVSEKYGL